MEQFRDADYLNSLDLKLDLGFDLFGLNSSNFTSSKMSADVSSSTSAFVSTFVVNLIVAVCFFAAFTILRTRFKRVYQPRTLNDLQTVSEEEKIKEPPKGYFSWLPYLLTKPHSFLVQHAGVDGYFYLRFLGVFLSFSAICIVVLFPILLPVNATNGFHLKGFEILSYANVKDKHRLYAHVFLSWCVYAIFLFIMYKELYHYIVFRHALQSTPLYDGLLSSRTVVLTELNDNLAIEGELEKIFPNVTKVIYAHDLKELTELCAKRQDNTNKLESALNTVINKSFKMQHNKSKKKLDKLYNNGTKPKDDLETYVPLKKRPKHRTGKWYLPPMKKFFNREKVNTIDYSSHKIVELNEKINGLQVDWEFNKRLNSVFLEFENQIDAQTCYQSATEVLGFFNFGKKFIGVTPEDINWSNVNLSKKERYVRYILANTFLTAMIIFWAIPTAVVGVITNVNFLTTKVPFLHFINNMPTFLLGIITGLLPTIALAILMSLVPPIIKLAGRMSGTLTTEENSVFTQTWFYAFQVIQVFLVTTLTSSASATVEAIINNPGNAMTLLASNLPKASNFYITYFLLQGLSQPTGLLLQIVNFLIFNAFSFLDSTPRQKWKRYNTLNTLDYSIIYPTAQILVCIFLSYIIIAPIILVFSTFAFILIYVAYLYNTNYVVGFSPNDLRGKNYPHALFQAMVPIYLCQVCLLGLFIMSKAWGPLALEVIAIAATALIHSFYKWWFLPMIDCVPISVLRIAKGELDPSLYPINDLGRSEINQLVKDQKVRYKENLTGGVIRDATKWELKHANLLPSRDSKMNESSGDEKSESENVGSSDNATKEKEHERQPSNVTGATFVPEDETFRKYTYKDIENLNANKNSNGETHVGLTNPPTGVVTNEDVGKVYRDPEAMLNESNAFPPNVFSTQSLKRRFLNFFQPTKAYSFALIRNRLPHVFNTTIEYDDDYLDAAYTNPCVREKEPIIWVCRDPMGVSQQQIREARDIGVDVRDDFTEFNDKGKPTFTFNPPDYERKIKR